VLGSTLVAALLECQKLLGTEGLVMNLGGGLDQVLEMSTSEEVPQVHKFTVVLIFDFEKLATGIEFEDRSYH
jgi:hypothetical protein